MGQAMSKLESYYGNLENNLEKHRKKHGNNIEKLHVYNNLDNDDDYYIRVLYAKSNALKKYLDRNIENSLENEKEVETMTIRLVGKEENMENEYLSIEDAANYLNCTGKTIRNRINKDGMPYVLEKNKKMISIKNLEKWKNGKPEEVKNMENSIVGNMENENMEDIKNLEPVDNFESEKISDLEIIYEPEIIEPEKKYVTQDELNSYTFALKDFTEAINSLRQEISDVKSVQEEMQRQKDEEKLSERIKELDEKFKTIQEKQNSPWYKKIWSSIIKNR